MGPTGLLITGILAGFITIVTAVFQYVEKSNSANEAKKYKIQNEGFQKTIIAQANKIAELNEEIKNQVTGGGAKPMVTPSVNVSVKHGIGFGVGNDSNYPISDVIVTVIYINQTEGVDNAPVEQREEFFRKATYYYQIGTMAPHSGTERDLPYRKGDETAIYSFNVAWRNGIYHAHIEFTKDRQGQLQVTQFKREGKQYFPHTDK